MKQVCDLDVLDRPGLHECLRYLADLQDELCCLSKVAFGNDELPNYQVFDTTCSHTFDDKIIVTARKRDGSNELVAFCSAVVLQIEGRTDPVIHTGLTVVHPDYRKCGLVKDVFTSLFVHLLCTWPQGVWLSTLARVVTSLVHIAKFTKDVYPSPQWVKKHGDEGPSPTHVQIARDIAARHRKAMLVPPNGSLDEKTFLFRGSIEDVSTYEKDVNDRQYHHSQQEFTDFYLPMLTSKADEVLQISFLECEHMLETARNEAKRTKKEKSKL